jgi:hypothetical protein
VGKDCEGDGSLLIVNAWAYALGIPFEKEDSKATIDMMPIMTNAITIIQDKRDLWKCVMFILSICTLYVIVFDFFPFYSTTLETFAKNNKETR